MGIYRYRALFGTDLSVFLERPITTGFAVLTLATIGFQIYRQVKGKV